MHFHRIEDAALERAKRILVILELTEFRWTILDVLAQPEAELETVFALKAIGSKIKTVSSAYHRNKASEQI